MTFDDINSLIATCAFNGVSPDMRTALEMVKPEMVEDKNQRLAIEAIKSLDNFGSTVSENAIFELLLKKTSFDNVNAILKSGIPTSSPIRLANQIVSRYNDKLALSKLSEMVSKLSSGLPFDRNEVSSELQRLSGVLAPVINSEPISFAKYASGYVDVLESRQNNPSGSFLDVGLDVLIDKTALIVLGGQPGMGKTALALYCNDFVARAGKKTLMFSLEMDGGQLFERQVSAYSKIPVMRLKKIDYGENELSDTQWGVLSSSVCDLEKLPIFIDDDPNLTVPTLVRKCKEFKEKHPDLALITIDYLTLMKMPEAARRDLSVGEATRIMKVLAKEIKTPILLLSQLNREADKAAREPRNSDLRDSGSIEQDADVIIFPYREEVHNPNSINKGLAKIKKTKVRDGVVGDHVLRFENGAFMNAFGAEWKEQKPEIEDKPFRKKF